jgi:hypothetical protein
VTDEELENLRRLTGPGCLAGSVLEAVRMLIEIAARAERSERPAGLDQAIANGSKLPTPGSLYLDPDGGTWRMGSNLAWHRVNYD